MTDDGRAAMRRTDRLLYTFLAVAVGLFVLAMGYTVYRYHHLIADCMADGKREYQCDGILKGRD